jgi:WD40 repeat protein
VVEEDDLHLFDVATGNPTHRLKHYWASRVAFAPHGKALASARGQTIRWWDTATGKEMFTQFEGHQAGVSSVAISSDGKRVASAGDHIRIWLAGTGKRERMIEVRGHVASLAFARDDKTLVGAGRDKIVHLWDVATGKPAGEFKGHKHMLCGVALSPDGRLLASGDVQSTIRIWDFKTGKVIHEFDLQSGTEALSLAFSPDSKTLACGGAWNDSSFLPKGVFIIQGVKMTRKEGNFVLQWDVATGKEIRRFGGLKDKIKSIAFAPDGHTLAAASRDGTIALWDSATGKERLYIVAHPNHKEAAFSNSPCLVFSPDSKLLASASTDQTIRFWDTATAKKRGQIRSPNAGFLALAFFRDGKRLVSGSAASTLLVWDWLAAVQAPPPKKPKVLFLR